MTQNKTFHTKTNEDMEQKIEKTKVYNVIIMDRSGSMWDIQKPAIMGFNEVLGGVKAAQTKYAETQEQFITLVLFDSSSKELKGDENHSVIVTVITDGYENDSHEYSLAAVKALVEHLKDEGWSFAYMGTDHDVHGVSISLSITNVVKFEKTEAETVETFKKERRARERWAEEENLYSLNCPGACLQDRIRAQKERSSRYYKEDPNRPEKK